MESKDSTNSNTLVGNRPSARWLRKRGEERATGQGAAVLKRKLCNGTSETEDDDAIIFSAPTKKQPGINHDKEPLDLICCWGNCDYTTDHYENFIGHINQHSLVDRIEAHNGVYECGWINCNFTIDSLDLYQCHINYHPYIEKLKNIGHNIQTRSKLNHCNDEEFPLVPQIDDVYRCEWEDCTLTSNGIQSFIFHVRSHVNSSLKKCPKGSKEFMKCEWRGCNIKVQRLTLLNQHVRTHTKEKQVACPQCNSTFASNTKFYDHCKRHDDAAKLFQCNQCQKKLATKRLLRDHIRLHVNNYKCNLCDMTCISPAALSRHIRYRHLSDRPFKCTLCFHGAVSKNDLQSHMLTHCADNVFECDHCEFKCRSAVGLESHLIKLHNNENEAKVYICHCCSKTFTRGDILTKHLLKTHNFQWPSGHSRFRYKQSPADGYYRLHTFRFETIEVTEEIIRGPQQSSGVDVKCVSSETQSDLLSQSDNSNNLSNLNPLNVVSSDNFILIDILDVDEKGNPIHSEMVESNEFILGI